MLLIFHSYVIEINHRFKDKCLAKWFPVYLITIITYKYMFWWSLIHWINNLFSKLYISELHILLLFALLIKSGIPVNFRDKTFSRSPAWSMKITNTTSLPKTIIHKSNKPVVLRLYICQYTCFEMLLFGNQIGSGKSILDSDCKRGANIMKKKHKKPAIISSIE